MEEKKGIFKRAARRFKQMFKALMVMVVIGGFVSSFYSGMYVVASNQSPGNPQTVMFSAIDSALKSTEEQPLIVIVPELSLLEKAMFWKDIDEYRDVIFLNARQTTMLLTGEDPDLKEPGAVEQAWVSAKSGITDAYDWIAETVK